MSKDGYPYDNVPMERYFNTLQNECTNLYEFRTQEELYRTVEEFAYATYNHVCPHSYNGYRTLYQVRTALIAFRQQSNKILATSVTKTLDHNNLYISSRMLVIVLIFLTFLAVPSVLWNASLKHLFAF